MGRPTILTEALREQIEQALADGVPIVVAAQRANVSAKSVSRWLRSGQIVRRRPLDPLALVPEGPAESPEATLDERLAKVEPGLVAVVIAASQRGSWQAAAWLLERTHPEQWAKPTRARLVEAETPAVEPDPFAEVDQLAARRRAALQRTKVTP